MIFGGLWGIQHNTALVRLLDEMGFGISELPPGKDGSGDGSDKVLPPHLVWTSIGAVAQVLKSMGLKRYVSRRSIAVSRASIILCERGDI